MLMTKKKNGVRPREKAQDFFFFLGYDGKLLKSEISPVTFLDKRFLKTPQKIGFIKRVDKGWITTVKDLESWRFERQSFVRAKVSLTKR